MKHLERTIIGTLAFAAVGVAGFAIYRRFTQGTVSRMKPPFKGPIFPYPITSGVVTDPFGRMRSTGPHSGIDLGTRFNSAGEPDPNGKPDIGLILTAPFDGKVVTIFDDAGGGLQMIIEADDGTKVGFAHLLKTSVAKGERFQLGDIIGACGNSGKVTGPHLHLTVRDPSGQLVDPAPYLGL